MPEFYTESDTRKSGTEGAPAAGRALGQQISAEEDVSLIPTRSGILKVAASAFFGMIVGVGAATGTFPSLRLNALLHLGEPSDRIEMMEGELASLHQQSAQLAAVQAQLERVTDQVEHMDGAGAYAEARRLGIIHAVQAAQPELGPSAVRRMGIALVRESRRNHLDPLLLTAVARVESRFNPFATSGSGARGLLQLTPVTGRTLSHWKGEHLSADAQLYDIETNVALGARYLSVLLKQFRSTRAALLAYNRGIGATRHLLRAPDAARYLRGYPRAVLRERSHLAQLAAATANPDAVSM